LHSESISINILAGSYIEFHGTQGRRNVSVRNALGRNARSRGDAETRRGEREMTREIDEITGEIIDAAYKLHTGLGPGLQKLAPVRSVIGSVPSTSASPRLRVNLIEPGDLPRLTDDASAEPTHPGLDTLRE